MRAKGESGLGNRRYISSDEDRRQRRMAVLGRIEQSIEGGAVATRRSMSGRRLHAGVVPMDDVSDRIQRERQQQAHEDDS